MEYYKYLRQYVGHAPIMLVGSGVIIYKGRSLLLQKRADDLCWGYHGGIVDLNEDTEEAARRELIEEIGIKVGKLTLFGVYSGKEQYAHYANGDEVHYVNIVYTADEIIGSPVPDNGEVLECAWFDIDSLPHELHSSDERVFKDFASWLRKKEGWL